MATKNMSCNSIHDNPKAFTFEKMESFLLVNAKIFIVEKSCLINQVDHLMKCL